MKVGLQVFIEEGFINDLRSKRIGVVTNHTGIHPQLGHIIDLFLKEGLEIVAIFVPEHGFMGNFPAGVKFDDSEYKGLKVYSLYGKHFKPPKDIMRKLDAIIFDLQDIGIRFYTYISTLFYVIEAAVHTNVEVFVLDRPNPLTGSIIEGPSIKEEFKSFIGVWNIPLRYGMTIGELAKLFNDEAGFNVDLHVIAMKGWRRSMWFDDTGLPWIPPSPAMLRLNTAIIYPGTALFEGTNVSEGRGTSTPFEVIGAPWINKHALSDAVSSLSIEGVEVSPIDFVPSNLGVKYSGERCEGIFINVKNREKFRPVRFGISVLWTIKKLYPDKFHFTLSNGKYYFDLMIGNSLIREMINSNAEIRSIIELIDDDLESFKNRIRKHQIYRD
jgi:uncharacterized protein YbbC (DUF1343 family)